VERQIPSASFFHSGKVFGVIGGRLGVDFGPPGGHLGVTLVSEKHFGGVWESILDLPGASLESFWGPKSKEFRGSVSESFFFVFVLILGQFGGFPK
jgi:hypothetical protein